MEVILGTAQLDGRYGRFRESFDKSNRANLLEAAWLHGFSVLDTAPAYEGVEKYVGDSGWAGEVHTKLGRGVSETASLQASLTALRRERVDVLYFHDPAVLRDSGTDFKGIRNKLPRSKVQRLGVSIYTPGEMKMALDVPELEAIQLPLNVADGRFDVSLLEQARSQGVCIYARSVFLQGLLLQKAKLTPENLFPLRRVIKEMAAVAEDSQRSIAEVAIGWVRSLPGIYGIVLGAETPKQVEQLGQACQAPALSDAELARLKALQVTDSALLDPRLW